MTDPTEAARPAVHWENPWNEAVPVPLEELAACVAGGTVRAIDGVVRDYTVDYVLKEWRRYGDRLDGYLLTGGDRFHSSALAGHISVGVRYGAEGEKYLSPHCQNQELARALIRKYAPRNEEETAAPPAP